MIRAIVTDVDGVIVSKKPGTNFPLPNELVIDKLKELQRLSVPVVLCTAKFKHGILELVRQAGLHNPHITDGGALIINPLDNEVVQEHTLSRSLAQSIVATCLGKDIYTECYGPDDYFVQADQNGHITDLHTKVIQKAPQLSASLVECVSKEDIVKIIAVATDDSDKPRIEAAISKFKDQIHVVWTFHPSMTPTKLCIITIKGVSKQHATTEVLNHLGMQAADTLGIGDTLGDWNFMQICGYAATVGGDRELQARAKSKGEGKYFIAPSVDDNGFLKIINHFGLSTA